MTFVKGQSGNPNGRPAILRDFRSRCRLFMTKTGWGALEDMANDPESVHRFRALELIAAYAHGRPTQLIAGDPDAEIAPMIITVAFDHADQDSTLSLPDAS